MGSIVSWMVLEANERPSFVVNTAVASVNTTRPTPTYMTEAGASFKSKFQAADSIMIIEYGFRLPYCFGLGADAPVFEIGWASWTGTNLTYLSESFLIPLSNEMITFKGSQQEGLFLRHYSLSYPDPGVAGQLAFRWGNVPISMIGAPEILNGTTQYVDVFFKVQHQLAFESLT